MVRTVSNTSIVVAPRRECTPRRRGTAHARCCRAPSIRPGTARAAESCHGGPFQPATFFSDAPAGFVVFSVIQDGAGSMIYLQELAALGAELRDKRVVISFTPGDFLDPMLSQEAYAANFSRLHALRLAFGD